MDEIALEIKGLKKKYPSGFLLLKKIDVLKDIYINAYKGEIYSFIGHNGAGKTTTFKTVLGFIKPDSGEITLFGEKIGLKQKKRIGFLPERPYFYDYLTAKEYLLFTAGLFNLKDGEKKADELLELVDLKVNKNLRLRKFSKGMLQKLGIAQAIINDPDFLILDEPLGGLDPIGRKNLKDIIIRLKEQGKTIVFSSHILQDAEAISDRVGIIIRGKTVKEGVLKDILEESFKGVKVSVYGVKDIPKSIKYSKMVFEGELLNMEFNKRENAFKFIDYVVKNGGEIRFVDSIKKTLEEIFVELKNEDSDNS
jgi:ABC-2 type transport system ATP-binding protein